ncbi:Mur ligase family protein [Kocuria tytonicola]|uniref:Lipid II isoglutaminyl synthase (glutamine-hydrolyzing) subunit MurT n=1 Tax=Kocuria tytonicola TaxID=2055946 RepID=A0A3L9L7Z4_9MICC|nr:Mur ligase family protein [Kocuria tytonicola]RLY95023.1 Mur ligase family protein [Kocuria tytonicola]
METMSRPLVRVLGQGVRWASSLRGGGSAFPGLFMEKLHPGFVAEELAKLPRGVVVISGTNGKTTTTKMTVQLLRSQGLRVFTNRTGSNFVRGVAASLLAEMDAFGRLDADVAVLELDEAHAVHFVKQVRPRICLLLNVMRDQLDRFGEIDTTRRMLRQVALATTETVVLNREDPRIAGLAEDLPAGTGVSWFGLSDALRPMFPSDDDMRDGLRQVDPGEQDSQVPSTQRPDADVVLRAVNARTVELEVRGAAHEATVDLYGVYNQYNAAAALAASLQVLGDDADVPALVAELGSVTPAFGRGETITVEDKPLQLLLVKNPAGFRLSLASASAQDYATMIAINDQYADGRDVSWLWDVDFDSLREGGVDVVSGVRAWDMALRLDYDLVRVGTVEPELEDALKQFIAQSGERPMRIFCTYTAMLSLRKILGGMTHVAAI